MDYTELVKALKSCFHYHCDEDCPWYDWDDGFRCKRYKAFDRVDEFFDKAVEALKEKE